MFIHTQHDANETHALIHFIEKSIREMRPDTYKGDIMNNETIIKNKRAVRAYDAQEKDRRIIQDDPYGYYTVLITLPEDVTDPEAYFEDNERLTAMPSQYDCTGQHFTLWHKTVKRQGRYMIYHHVGIDI